MESGNTKIQDSHTQTRQAVVHTVQQKMDYISTHGGTWAAPAPHECGLTKLDEHRSIRLPLQLPRVGEQGRWLECLWYGQRELNGGSYGVSHTYSQW